MIGHGVGLCRLSRTYFLPRRILRSTILYVGVQLLLSNSLHSVHSFTFILFLFSLSPFKKNGSRICAGRSPQHTDPPPVGTHEMLTLFPWLSTSYCTSVFLKKL